MPELSQLQTVVNALGWMLVHFIWQGCAIAGALWVVCKLSRHDSANLRYWAGLAAYSAAALAPALTLAWYLRPAPTPLGAAEMVLPTITVATGYRVSGWEFIQASLEPTLPLIVVLWAIGVTILSSRTMLGWLGTRRLVNSGSEAVGSEIRKLADDLRRQLGVRRAVQVLRSTRVAVPTVIGWLKPIILLPASVIAQLPREQLEMILAHELAHVRRHDYLVNLLQLVIETLFFYHPAIRWMSRQVRQEREHCCDDLVVDNCGRPVVYARALASLEVLREPVRPPALSASGGDLFQRVSRIVRREGPSRNSGFAQVALVIGLAAIASVSAHRGLEIARVTSDLPMPAARPIVTEAAPVAPAGVGAGLERHTELVRQAQQHAEETARQAELQRLADAEQASLRRETQARDEAARLEALSQAATELEESVQSEPAPEIGTGLIEQDEAILLASVDTSALQEALEAQSDPVEELFQPTARAVSVVAPDYPRKALRDDVEGWVKLRFSVNQRGKVTGVEVIDAQPLELFDAAATRALKKWKFEVGADHDPELRLLQTFDFALEDPQPESGNASMRCSLTGSRICPKNLTDEDIYDFYSSEREKPETPPE